MRFLELFLKSMMVAFSGIILVAGVAGLAGGVWMRVSPGTMLDLLGQIDGTPLEELEKFLNSLNYLLMAVGALLAIMGFLGCYGAIRECRKMLLLHFVIALILFTAQMAGAMVAFAFMDQLATKAVDDIKKKYGDKSGLLTQFWKVTMDTLGCCGVHNYTDFIGSPQFTETETFPPQCCPSEPGVDRVYCDSHQAHNASSAISGCLPKFRELIAENQRLMALVILGVMYVEMCTMVLSMILFCKMRMRRMVRPEETT